MPVIDGSSPAVPQTPMEAMRAVEQSFKQNPGLQYREDPDEFARRLNPFRLGDLVEYGRRAFGTSADEHKAERQMHEYNAAVAKERQRRRTSGIARTLMQQELGKVQKEYDQRKKRDAGLVFGSLLEGKLMNQPNVERDRMFQEQIQVARRLADTLDPTMPGYKEAKQAIFAQAREMLHEQVTAEGIAKARGLVSRAAEVGAFGSSATKEGDASIGMDTAEALIDMMEKGEMSPQDVWATASRHLELWARKQHDQTELDNFMRDAQSLIETSKASGSPPTSAQISAANLRAHMFAAYGPGMIDRDMALNDMRALLSGMEPGMAPEPEGNMLQRAARSVGEMFSEGFNWAQPGAREPQPEAPAPEPTPEPTPPGGGGEGFAPPPKAKEKPTGLDALKGS